MSRKLIMQIITALMAYFGLTAAGWNGSEPTSFGGGVSFNPQMMKLILTVVAAFVPQLADRFVPGLGKILSELLDKLLGKTPAPTDETGLIVSPINSGDRMQSTMHSMRELKSLMYDNEEASKLIAQLIPLVWEELTRKPEIVVNASKK